MLAPDPGSAGFSRPSRARWAPHLPGPSVGGGRLPRAGGEGAAPPSAFSEGRGAAGAVGAVQVPPPRAPGRRCFPLGSPTPDPLLHVPRRNKSSSREFEGRGLRPSHPRRREGGQPFPGGWRRGRPCGGSAGSRAELGAPLTCAPLGAQRRKVGRESGLLEPS